MYFVGLAIQSPFCRYLGRWIGLSHGHFPGLFVALDSDEALPAQPSTRVPGGECGTQPDEKQRQWRSPLDVHVRVDIGMCLISNTETHVTIAR